MQNTCLCKISIHAPLAGCDSPDGANVSRIRLFQSTHPLRGATSNTSSSFFALIFQSTHPLRGATVHLRQVIRVFQFQSTHPLRGATPETAIRWSVKGFQSTHPLRGATHAYDEFMGYEYISIHAPLAGCDCRILLRLGNTAIFQSTHPLRGATVFGNRVEQRRKFQSTHPLRGATYICGWSTRLPVISIHAPLAGCDFVSPSSAARSSYISIHAPLAGCDDQHYTIDRLVDISIHAPLAGCDENY